MPLFRFIPLLSEIFFSIFFSPRLSMVYIRLRRRFLHCRRPLFFLLSTLCFFYLLWTRKVWNPGAIILTNFTDHRDLSTFSHKDCSNIVAELIKDGSLLKPARFPNYCHKLVTLNEDPRYIGCFYYEQMQPPLRLVFYNETLRNSPSFCVTTCRWAGLAFAGLAESSLCYCDRKLPIFMVPSVACGTATCPGDPLSTACGSKTAIEIFATGVTDSLSSPPALATVSPSVPLDRWSSIFNEDFYGVKIVYILVLTGRSWRQVQRMFRLLYHTSNYFYIHVDTKSEYLYSRCQRLARLFPNNVYLTPNRQNLVWGAPRLLDLMLSIVRDLFHNFSHWKWDFLVNLSETDLPVMPINTLVHLLDSYRGRIFVKDTAEETFKYIYSEGLQYAFMQCGNYVWRVGVRHPVDGIVIHGGSDWLVLPRDFALYAALGNDDLVRGLRIWFQNVILPVESFFHTLAHNSRFCERIINANLRLTNWQRPQGCSCKKTSVADWCGCSPSVFSGPKALLRLHEVLNVAESSSFARKFDSTIDVAMINYIERRLLGRNLPAAENLELYLESIFSSEFDATRAQAHLLNGINYLIKMVCETIKSFQVNCNLCHDLHDVVSTSGSVKLLSRPVDLFALFNSTRTLGGINYTQIGGQLDRDGFLPSAVLGSTLPLRPLHPPDLVIRLSSVEVLFRPQHFPSQAWISPQPPETLNSSEVLYFELGFAFDAKELIFRNYHRFTPSLRDVTSLTLLVIWRDSQGNATSLKVRVFEPETESLACSFVMSRGPKDAPYPGLPGFRASFVELDLLQCARGKVNDGVWKIAVEDKGVKFSTNSSGGDIWRVADFCGSCLGTPCTTKLWSSFRVDNKSTLGQYDAATGLLRLDDLNADILDIAI